MTKYRLLRDLLLNEGILQSEELFESPIASDDLLALAHDSKYVHEVRTGEINIQTIKRIGFPWSFELYLRSCATVGGAVQAALSALDEGLAGNLAGGTHHAHADRGEGYCVFNDIAVASRYLLKEKRARRIAIIDLDVHQGNGNSSILGKDDGVFIFSIHGEKNYPFKKIPSTLDIALPDGATDELYQESLATGLKTVAEFSPDFVFYQMGVDPLKEDRLGKMNLTFQGLIDRDEQVFNFSKTLGIPMSLALGGGYAEPIELTVRAYANTYKTAKRFASLK
jgi:acetoin utilization deacetylase AcuC-like enzyme